MAVLRLELGALRLCHTAREPVALVGEALALDRELGGLAQARAQRRGRAAALLPSDGPAPEDPEAARGLLEAQVEPYRDQIAALEREVERLTDQIANRDAAAVEAMAQAEQRIEDLKRENAQLREDLALSRRLEGFHWPWTRDRIKAQHLLPKSTE